ncbi:hypothetical protein GCM10010873_29360 [Cypionkella aquatica]|uniref:Uncharacterized protein n=1 Tax=Cypionkella aquatica TaxID=1756042 RepID=A0AA37X1G9_9RHOB|nr:hypothetical protein GCM10010873_29360 [Cypionkella aquatica]
MFLAFFHQLINLGHLRAFARLTATRTRAIPVARSLALWPLAIPVIPTRTAISAPRAAATRH